jgi:hypothetical protein
MFCDLAGNTQPNQQNKKGPPEGDPFDLSNR